MALNILANGVVVGTGTLSGLAQNSPWTPVTATWTATSAYAGQAIQLQVVATNFLEGPGSTDQWQVPTFGFANATLTQITASTAATLGTTAPTISDSAVLAGGYNETGTVNFTLKLGSTTVYTTSDPVSGNGTYTASYTLPTTGTVTGTYAWTDSYSGDTNNNAASGNTDSSEQTVVSAASPTLSTTPSATSVTLGNATPPVLKDTATLAGGYYETGDDHLYAVLRRQRGGHGDGGGQRQRQLHDAHRLHPAHHGHGDRDLPVGRQLRPRRQQQRRQRQQQRQRAGGGRPGQPHAGHHGQFAAVTLGTTAPTISDSAVLAGGYNETGSVSFTLKLGSTTVYTTSDTVSGDGTYSASYTLPTTGTVTGTYAWTDSYSGDTNNNSASGNTDSSEQTVVSAASPTLSTTPSATSITLGNSGSPVLKDTAALAGGYYETGDITFTLYCGNSLVDTETVSVSGNGSYTTPTGYTLPTTGTVTGTYQWDASYGPDGNNNAASDNNNANEQVAVGLASPTLVTTASAAVTLGTTAPTISDSAVLAGGYNETGSVSFTLKLGSTTVYTTSDTVSGDGTYTASYTLPTTGTVTGTYAWTDSYSGDTNNNSASGNTDSSEQTVVSAGQPHADHHGQRPSARRLPFLCPMAILLRIRPPTLLARVAVIPRGLLSHRP